MTTSDRQIIFYLDFISPFAYLANSQLPALAARHGAVIDYRPVDVMLAKLAAGNFAPSTRQMPLKRRFIGQDKRAWAQRYGIPMNDPQGPRATRLNAGVLLARDRGCAKAYVDAAFMRVRGRGQGPDDDAVVAAVTEDMGWAPNALFDFVGLPETSVRFDAMQREAYRLGVFGVPMMIVDDQLFWGNDRLDFLDDYLTERAATS